ncbi:hypothetical protein [Streptomyces odontomachi]|uniref:hypothetical protein n=1 Tax=Streptomyces odontomachi TaxID=2944940 RepID=UPI00210ED272|nr:hypothetical protein [Streptomyces sp. ODS25]
MPRNRKTCAVLLGVSALLGTVLCAPYAAGAAPHAAPVEAVPNTDPGFLQVYDANVENLPTSTETCKGDWHDLMYYMRLQRYRPDIYLVQQLSGQDQLDLLLSRMEEHFGEKFEGVVAEANPKEGGGTCGPEKDYQTNAVIWRADRLELTLSQSPDNRWQAQYAPDPDQPAYCVNGTASRTKGVKALLHDRIADKDVTAASFHWPTQTNGGGTAACAVSNAGELSNELTEDGYGVADLFVAGGDTNRGASTHNGQDDWTDWYAATNADVGGAHGFRDAVYQGCGGDAVCAGENWSIQSDSGPRRIDFLFAREPGGTPADTSDTVVPDFDDADQADIALTGDDNQDLNYSDHRAVGSRVHY